ncbi:DNA adenine methylase [Biomaibacter acetigenes]|nr:DNA adenine methylase [Biomaibacter acetigenes]
MSSNLRFFDALPAYYGDKRKLVKAIFKVAPPASQAPTFADAFLGGGAVSVMAKALGYRVLCNDIAQRSYIVGKALVENNRVKLTDEDINRLFLETENDGFIRANFSPTVILSKHADFLDNAFALVRAMEEGHKKYLLLLLLVKYIFSMREYKKFSTPNAFNIPMEERRIEWIKNRTYHASIKAVLKPIPEALREFAGAVNRGVIDNAQENRAFKLDVREFLQEIQADVVYFDPPYAGTMAYEDNYHALDQILEGRMFPARKSEFSRKDGMKFLDEVFQAARHIPIWIASMGNAGGANDLSELQEMVARYRRTETYRIKYRHIPAVATEEHQAKNEEFLIVGRPR